MTRANSKAKNEQRFAVTVPAGPTETTEVSKFLPAEPMRISIANKTGMEAYLACCKPITFLFTSHQFGPEWVWRAHLSYVWTMAIPKVAMKPRQSALTTQPTAILMSPPFTAENIWPATMHPMIPQPVCIMRLRIQVSFEGQ